MLAESTTTTLDPNSLIGGLIALATIISGVIKWVGNAIVKSIDRVSKGLHDNTTALNENTDARRDSNKLKTGAATVIVAALCLLLSGCVAGPDPLALEFATKAEKYWREDQRADLNPEVIQSRENFFAAGKRYFRGSPEAAKTVAETR